MADWDGSILTGAVPEERLADLRDQAWLLGTVRDEIVSEAEQLGAVITGLSERWSSAAQRGYLDRVGDLLTELWRAEQLVADAEADVRAALTAARSGLDAAG